MGSLLADPPRPFVVILGGAKVSDKLGVLSALAECCDVLAIGGGMAFTALAAQGHAVGRSLLDEQLMRRRSAGCSQGARGDRVLLPVDVVVAGDFRADAEHRVTGVEAIRDDEMGLDIGPAAAARIAEVCRGAGTVFWNGPMGVFEWEAFRSGTESGGPGGDLLGGLHGGGWGRFGGGDPAAGTGGPGVASVHRRGSRAAAPGGNSPCRVCKC